MRREINHNILNSKVFERGYLGRPVIRIKGTPNFKSLCHIHASNDVWNDLRMYIQSEIQRTTNLITEYFQFKYEYNFPIETRIVVKEILKS